MARAVTPIKILVLGVQGVGKTTLVERLSPGYRNTGRYYPTLEITVTPTEVWLDEGIISATIWDTVANPIIKMQGDSLATIYEGTHMAIVIYDVNSRASFYATFHFHVLIRKFCPKAVTILCGNKIDTPNVIAQELVELSGCYDLKLELSMTEDEINPLAKILTQLLESKGQALPAPMSE